MTTDDLIAMHKAVESVIETAQQVSLATTRRDPQRHEFESLCASVTALATVQRDLLKAMIPSV